MNKNFEKELENLQFILKINNINENDIKLNSEKNNENILLYYKDYFKKRDKLIIQIKESKEKQNSLIEIRKLGNIDVYGPLFKIFTENKEYKSFNIEKNENLIKNNNFKNLYKNIFFKDDYSSIPHLYNKAELYVKECYKKLMNNLPELYLNLEQNGNVIFTFVNQSYDIIKFLYLCSLLFEEVYLIHRYLIFCRNFKNDIKHLKIITDIIQNDYNFYLSENIDIKNIFDYLKNHFTIDYKLKYELSIESKNQLYKLKYKKYFEYYINFIKSLGLNMIPSIKKNIKLIDKKININLKSDKIITYDDNFFKELLEKKNIKNILSLGDFNIIKNIKFNINEINNQKNIINHLNKLLFEKKKFDCIFFDNINDYNNLLFYTIFSENILNNKGLLIINNAHFYDINKCIIHIKNTIKIYKKLNGPSNYAIFQKI